MRINQQDVISITGSRLERTSQAGGEVGGAAGEKGRAGSAGDAFQLSGLAGRLLASAGSNPPGHAARLKGLESDWRAGRYVVDPMVVSRSLIDGALRPQA